MSKKILVIGSSNTDLIAKVERFPVAGETLTGKLFVQAMGGKGANQALAAHRAGGDVRFVTCLGNDANGRNALQYYTTEGLDVSRAISTEGVPTGTAMILVNDEGENVIVITPGANARLSPADIVKLSPEIADARMVMLQMEIPMDTVTKVCEVAAKYKTPVLLNVAPARPVDQALLRSIEILVVNETEIETVCGHTLEKVGEDGAMDMILKMGVKTVILTLGKKGCVVKSAAVSQRIPAFEVNAVDSTAAGDTFCGALVAQLSLGVNVVDAARFATAAAAICVTRMGAQPSIPAEQDIRDFLRTRATAQSNGAHIADRTSNKMIL